MDYMRINGNDQLDLKGSCLSGYVNQLTYGYNVYFLNSITDQWTLFTDTLYFHKPPQTYTDLTVSKNLFFDFSTQIIWKFELIAYVSGQNVTSSTSLIVYVNEPPLSGTCNISPTSGTTSSLFTIFCDNWSDSDGSSLSFSFYGNKSLNINF
jgi:hypothetical protein